MPQAVILLACQTLIVALDRQNFAGRLWSVERGRIREYRPDALGQPRARLLLRQDEQDGQDHRAAQQLHPARPLSFDRMNRMDRISAPRSSASLPAPPLILSILSRKKHPPYADPAEGRVANKE
jgi:hypothetical protein